MLSFYKMPNLTSCIDPNTGKTYGELLGEEAKKPACCQFTRFLKYSFDDYSKCPTNNFKLKEVCQSELPELSIVRICSSKGFLHEIFHLSDGICLEKRGSGDIQFSQIDQIIKIYQLLSNEQTLSYFELSKTSS